MQVCFMRSLDYSGAIREAMWQEMERDPSVFVYGIGVPTFSKIFNTTQGLQDKFGKERCFDTPISEDAMTGFGLGAAIRGLRPIHVHIRVDFMILATNQLVNMISNYIYSTGGRLKVPMVIRAVIGRGWGQGAQHSKSLFSHFTHIPGLKVIAPTTPSDMKGLLTAAIRDDNPVICLEHRWLYWAKEDVPEEPYVTPLGVGRILLPGRDVTIVGLSWMNVEARQAAEILARRGVSVEIVDPRTLAPLDEELIVESVSRTGRCIVADCDWISSGFSAEVAARVGERCFGKLKAPVRRIGFAHTPCPTVRELEDEFYPNAKTIVRTVENMLGLEEANLDNEDFFTHHRRFFGPF
jgi:pyruvate/2-oxoglutarate/acetoin dehydrogenase E1 component